MEEKLHTLSASLDSIQTENKKLVLKKLEAGKVIYLPHYSFLPHDAEQSLLSDSILDGKHKNISYDYKTDHLGGFARHKEVTSMEAVLHGYLRRYAEFAKNLLNSILPHYQQSLQWGRTSYRPAEIEGRKSSKRKDDTRLHVDSFPSTPVNGLRILRVFSNVNPYDKPRIWNLGEPFPQVLSRFAPDIPPYWLLKSKFLKLIKATKSLRTPYDHYMLHLHDRMKLDDDYQNAVKKDRMDFPAGSTWIVFTDHVSHAALSGQYLMEQTFYLPVEGMNAPLLSPLKQLEIAKPSCFN